MQFRLFSMFLLMTAAAVVAYVFTLDTSGGFYALLILGLLVVSSIGRNWFMNLSIRSFLKLCVLGALGGIAAWWCLILVSLATSKQPIAETLFNASLYHFYLMPTLASAAFGVNMAIMAWMMAKIKWKQPTPRRARILSGLIGSFLTAIAVCNLLEFSFSKPVSKLAWYDDNAIAVIVLSLTVGAFIGFKLCAAGQYMMARYIDTECHGSDDAI